MSEKEHELAYMLLHGASREMDWKALFGEAREEVLRLRKRQESTYNNEERITLARLKQASQATTGRGLRLSVTLCPLDELRYEAILFSAVQGAGDPISVLTTDNCSTFESMLSLLIDRHDAAMKEKGECATPS